MTAIIIIKFQELDGGLVTTVEGSAENATQAELARGMEVGKALKSTLDEMSQPTPGCNCHACQLNRGASDECKNFH